jgi:hypothetical protein
MIQFVLNNFPFKLLRHMLDLWYSVAQLVEALRYKSKVASSNPDGIIGIFHSFGPHCGSGVDFACNRNEFQEYFLGIKVASR